MAEKEDYNEVHAAETRMSDVGAFLYIIKAILGVGILAAPLAFEYAGYVTAIISTILIGVLIICSKMILFGVIDELRNREGVPLLTYGEVMRVALSQNPSINPVLRSVLGCCVNIVLVLGHICTCSAYAVFIAYCMKVYGDHYWMEIDIRYYFLIELVPLCLIYILPICLIPNLNGFLYYALGAIIAVIFGFAMAFYYIFKDMAPFSEIGELNKVELYPFFFGATIFAFDAPGLLFVVEANMKNPERFRNICGPYIRAMIIIIIFHIFFAFFGYWSFGNAIMGTILQNIPTNSVLAAFVNIFFVATIFISYPFQGYVPVDVIWNNWLKAKLTGRMQQLACEIALRTLVVLLSVLISAACPNLTILITVTGGVFFTLLDLTFPAILYICVKYKPGYGAMKLYLLLSILMILAGLAAAGICSYVAIRELMYLYTQPERNFKALFIPILIGIATGVTSGAVGGAVGAGVTHAINKG